MPKITVYTTGHPSACNRVQHVLDAQNLTYDLVMIDTDHALAELTKRSGRKSCPIVVHIDAESDATWVASEPEKAKAKSVASAS